MFSQMRDTAEKFGYSEYDAPILEPLELYLAKTSEEIVNEQTYSFTDRGGRNITLRPEMTPTVSRMVAARRQELNYPLRLYSIPNLWRYERPQRGRLREHWQLNVDIFGVEGIEADHEIILVADTLMKSFGAKSGMYVVRINSRKLMNMLLHEYLDLDETQTSALIRLIDRMHKIPEAEFFSQADMLLAPAQRESGLGGKIATLLGTKSISDLPPEIRSHQSVLSIQHLLMVLQESGVKNAVFDLTLMRGFDYYTDIVFEVFDTHEENNRSLFGGGRYDGLVAQFGVEPVPTVGFGAGDVTLLNFLQTHQLLPELPPETDATVLLIGDVYHTVQPILARLRSEGVRLAVDSSGRKLPAQLKSAVKSGVRYVLFLGEQEISRERFKVKDLLTGKEEEHGLERTVAILAAQHHSDDELA